jgi:hypothetical protein
VSTVSRVESATGQRTGNRECRATHFVASSGNWAEAESSLCLWLSLPREALVPERSARL